MTTAGSIRFLNSGRLVTSASWTKTPHQHPFHQFIVMIRGRFFAAIGQREFAAGKGDVLLYPADTEHREHIDPAAPPEFIYFGWNGPLPDAPLKAHDRRGRMQVLTDWLLDEDQRSGYPDRGGVCDSLLAAFLQEYIRASRHTEDRLAAQLRAYTRDHLHESLTLDRLADALNLNKFTLMRRMKNTVGTTPMAEVRRIRIEAARERVVSTDDTLARIAEIVGIGDERQLSRLFRKHYGVPPGYFRRP